MEDNIYLKIKKKKDISPNLKFRKTIFDSNESSGTNEIFDIFKSIFNKNIYLVTKNRKFQLDIVDLKSLNIWKNMGGHNSYIRGIKYYFNELLNDEYILSFDESGVVICGTSILIFIK